MSNPRALLARCAARGGSYSIGTGGAEFTPADIAHAAGRIREPAGRALVLYLWANHLETWQVVQRELLLEVAKLVAARGWRINRPGTLGGLIRLAVHEMGNPRHCWRCNGTGEHAGKPCEVCGGEGTLPYSERAQAFYSGLPHRTLRDWSSRYPEIAELIRGIERRAVKDMRRALT